MEEEWADIHNFPTYRVSSFGNVFNNITRRMMRTSLTKQGAVKVGLMEAGAQHTRSVKVLVADAFVKGKTHVFDTPIHLDGDQRNCRADNLLWRPRWFAWKYSRQFAHRDAFQKMGPIIDLGSGELYKTARECAIVNGLLFEDIRKSVIFKKPAFPDWRNYEIKK